MAHRRRQQERNYTTRHLRCRSPVQATLSWFAAINHKDKAGAAAHLEPAAAGQMNWGNGDTSTWPAFSALHCKQATSSAAIASVYCTFSDGCGSLGSELVTRRVRRFAGVLCAGARVSTARSAIGMEGS
jgi:hypothetical protein